MLEFKDIEFKKHPDNGYDKWGQIRFKNGYGLSVINGDDAYCDKYTYEVAFLRKNQLNFYIACTGDVLKYQTEKDITKAMITLQCLFY